ncbi:transketolase [Elusimicrobium posterum]|uniref:hypothetical protein n=1 Tax=Elusimicrobium posterum TaxID=3116653 RepID=UPI003C709705
MNKDFTYGKKRALYFNAADEVILKTYPLPSEEKEKFEKLDVIYRTLCAVLYNYAPLSGHPGGSISSGRIVQNLIYNEMAYNFADPHDNKADIISYAAGHKALGLYAMWALRNECVVQADQSLLPKKEKDQMRLEDLLGFRRNNATDTKYFKEFQTKPLGGHPEPMIPFVKTSTGASGVGVGSAIGMAFGAADAFEKNPPYVHIIEGEGGLTAGRCNEVIAMAATANLKNVVVHLDWNQASIDSDKVCSDGETPGDYVQWTPMELFRINDWNVIFVPEGHNYEQIHAAQKLAKSIENNQPTVIVYRTIKGWKYGLEGRSSHGSGHKFASEEYYHTLNEFETTYKIETPRFCGENNAQGVEDCFWDSIRTIRTALSQNPEVTKFFAGKVAGAAQRLKDKNPVASPWLGDVEKVYSGFNPMVPRRFSHLQLAKAIRCAVCWVTCLGI